MCRLSCSESFGEHTACAAQAYPRHSQTIAPKRHIHLEKCTKKEKNRTAYFFQCYNLDFSLPTSIIPYNFTVIFYTFKVLSSVIQLEDQILFISQMTSYRWQNTGLVMKDVDWDPGLLISPALSATLKCLSTSPEQFKKSSHFISSCTKQEYSKKQML